MKHQTKELNARWLQSAHKAPTVSLDGESSVVGSSKAGEKNSKVGAQGDGTAGTAGAALLANVPDNLLDEVGADSLLGKEGMAL
ncbi:hypothetical protein Acr_24g0016100 [Actinidia rufa]|uniref:Uncharacterized protein n=1 Tax=Actinidia rufa TaxID=165716 RepID=A0A7J0GX47_9ERIC|nr:hypothetical protein Acr_24g0016100 [Actinidia rufa]